MVFHLNTKSLFFCLFLVICINKPHMTNKIKSNLKNQESSNLKIQENTSQLDKSDTNNKAKFNSNFQFIVSGECSSKTCEFGDCKDKNTCICAKGYAQLSSDSSALLCTYKLKEQLVAFLLESFLVIGIGHFYCSRVLFGILKLLFLVAVVLIDFLLKGINPKASVNKNNYINSISYLLYFGFIGFHIYDITMFGSGKYTDGYGMPLYIRE